MTQDGFVGISPMLTALAVVFISFLLQCNKGKQRMLMADYRRGVRCLGGAFAGVLDPGSRRYDIRKEQLLSWICVRSRS